MYMAWLKGHSANSYIFFTGYTIICLIIAPAAISKSEPVLKDRLLKNTSLKLISIIFSSCYI